MTQSDLRSLSPTPDFVDSRLRGLAYAYFGALEFRDGQEEAVFAAIDKRDVFVRLATGVGKTLTVVLPPLYEAGQMTVMIVPLISLLRQHVGNLVNMSVHVAALHYGQADILRARMMALLSRPVGGYDMAHPLPMFLVITPEQLDNSSVKDRIDDLYSRGLIARFVIDEAQCAIQWASFRPAVRAFVKCHDVPLMHSQYNRNLQALRNDYPTAPITVISATMTDEQMGSLQRRLRLDKPVRVCRPLDRSNLRYEVRYLATTSDEHVLQAIVSFVRRRSNASGIIYCSTKSDCHAVTVALNAAGCSAASYYGGYDALMPEASGGTGAPPLTPDDRSRAMKLWQQNIIKTMVATISFAVGVHKDQVGYVAHYGPPETLCDWFQQSGRAGRDGTPASCVIFYRKRNLTTHVRLQVQDWLELLKVSGRRIEKYTPDYFIEIPRDIVDPILEMHLACLESISSGSCLRQAMLDPFDEVATCNNCSACHGVPVYGPMRDLSDFAVTALDALEECYANGAHATESVLAAFLSGQNRREVKGNPGLLKSRLRGSGTTFDGQSLTFEQVRFLLHVLLVRRAFKLVFKKTSKGHINFYLKAGELASNVRAGVEKIECVCPPLAPRN